MVTAFAPMAFFFSAVYSESLYLALSVGLFWSARQGAGAAVGVLGALAGATRSAGVVLLVPALILYLYGPREDRPPGPRDAGARLALAACGRATGSGARTSCGSPGAGRAAAVHGLSGARRRRPAGPFHAQDVWGRHFAGPFVGRLGRAQGSLRRVHVSCCRCQRTHVYFAAAGGSPFVDAGHNLMLLAFLLAAVPAVVGVVRMLPLAYGAYVLAALALPLSYPVATQPLMSLPRFLVVLFPLSIWLAARLAERPRAAAAGARRRSGRADGLFRRRSSPPGTG